MPNDPEFIPLERGAVFNTNLPEREVIMPLDPLYERQAPLNLQQPDVIVIGCGGVGCWVALSLALGGVKYLTLFDGDVLSTHNLNRFPLPMSSVGSLKSEALANWLMTLRPEAEIIARGSFDPVIHEDSARGDWLVCATDSLKSRRMSYDYAQRNGMRYLEVGADGERWTLSPSPPEFSTEAESEPGYTTVPVHVGPCMMAGAAAAYYVLHNCAPIASHSVGWIKGPIIHSMPNLGGLKFESMSEVKLPFITCPECGAEVEDSLIYLIKHLREHSPDMGLVEAKARAEHILEQVHAVEPEADELGNAILDNVMEPDDEVIYDRVHDTERREHGQEES